MRPACCQASITQLPCRHPVSPSKRTTTLPVTLSTYAPPAELVEWFGAIGVVKMDKKTRGPKVWLYRDKGTGLLKGDGTVSYEDPFSAASAVSWFHNKPWKGEGAGAIIMQVAVTSPVLSCRLHCESRPVTSQPEPEARITRTWEPSTITKKFCTSGSGSRYPCPATRVPLMLPQHAQSQHMRSYVTQRK